MRGADSSRARIIVGAAETEFGEVPDANLATTRLRFKSESLKHTNSTVISDEIRSDRQRSDLALVGFDAAGDINAELTYGNFDWMFEAALCGTWTPGTSVFADGVTNSTAVVTSATAAFSADDKFKPISGAGIPANSYIGVINSATSIGLSSSKTANVPVNASATATGVSITIGSVGVPRASHLMNGTVNRSFPVEKGFLDIGKNNFYPGCGVNTLGLDVTSRQIVQLTAGLMAKRAYASASSIAGTTVPTEPNGNQIITAGPLIQLVDSGTPNIELNGIFTKEVKLMINNNFRVRDAATQYETDDFGRGVMEITGSLNAYFEDIDILNAFIANQVCALRYSLTDPVDNRLSYRLTLPKIKLPDVSPVIGGVDADVMLPIQFRALVDDNVGYTLFMERGVTILPTA